MIVLGTPNTVSVDNNCHVPRTTAARYTFGAMPFPDYSHPPECLMIWGRNALQTGGDGSSAQLRPALDGTAELIVIDPRKIWPVSKSALRLKPKPGSDGLLALGMLNVVINEKLRLNADLDPRVVVAAYGWWFPEKGPHTLFGWREANLNLLTDGETALDPAIGSANLRGLNCRVYKDWENSYSLFVFK